MIYHKYTLENSACSVYWSIPPVVGQLKKPRKYQVQCHEFESTRLFGFNSCAKPSLQKAPTIINSVCMHNNSTRGQQETAEHFP